MASRHALHDVADVSKFCFAIAERSGLELNWSDREDLEAYLVETCWSLSLTFEPGGISFESLAQIASGAAVAQSLPKRLKSALWRKRRREREPQEKSLLVGPFAPACRHLTPDH